MAKGLKPEEERVVDWAIARDVRGMVRMLERKSSQVL